ncbi:MAG: CBS domain-containing protein [Eubacteriales bacterium]|nr:CBS domain-containing protein [Eubacteriales bacterium]
MYVKNSMTVNPCCIDSKTNISTALDIMKNNDFHRIPVVDAKGKLLGLITEGVIAENTPSRATSLSIYELNYLLSKTTVESIMISDVHTISPDALIEEAASLMRKHSIGYLPVVENDVVVGVITYNDIFDSFIDLLGYNIKGSRYMFLSEDKAGEVAAITKCFADNGINIVTVASFRGKNHGKNGVEIIVVTRDTKPARMKQALLDSGFNLIDVREIQ